MSENCHINGCERRLLGAERDAADEVSRTARAYVGAMERKLRAAREFVIRHPGLTLIDLAEFDAFLKMEAALDAVSSPKGSDNG